MDEVDNACSQIQQLANAPWPELPATPWVRLQHATTFALHCHMWHRDLNSVADLAAMRLRGAREGTVLYGHAEREEVRAQNELDRRLSEAAFGQQVIFRARKKDHAGSEYEQVCHSYFKKPRGFSNQDDWIDRLPHGNWNDDYYLYNDATSDDDEWQDVEVKRDGFVSWLCEAYPSTSKLLGGEQMALQARRQKVVSHRPPDQLETAVAGLKECYPNGPGSEKLESVRARVNEWAIANGKKVVSRDTIRRAKRLP